MQNRQRSTHRHGSNHSRRRRSRRAVHRRRKRAGHYGDQNPARLTGARLARKNSQATDAGRANRYRPVGMELRRNSEAVPRILLTTCHPKHSNNKRFMKTIFSSALATFLTAVFLLTRLSASETPSTDMHLYPPTTINWKAGPAALPPAAKIPLLAATPPKQAPSAV